MSERLAHRSGNCHVEPGRIIGVEPVRINAVHEIGRSRIVDVPERPHHHLTARVQESMGKGERVEESRSVDGNG